MAANINDKLRGVRNGGSPQPSTISATRAISGTSLSAVALTNWFSDTPTDFITYKKTAAGAIDRTTLCGWEGIVSGNTINSLVLVFGTDAGNDIGDSIEAAPTDAWAQGIYDWGNTEHNVDGTHKASSIKTAYLADGSVTTDKVADASITASKIDFTTFGIWQDYTPTLVGFSTVPPGAVYRYRKVGTTVTVSVAQPTNGTSNSTSFTISLPFPAKTIAGMQWSSVVTQTIDNGAVNTTNVGICAINSGNTFITVYKNIAGTNWTASGGKRAPAFIIEYECD